MIVVTWIVPAVLFFVSIFGWEHFVGKRDLLPGECMVQFLKDPVFNTSLIVGYYWIPLTILIVLYSFIFHSAWTLSKKAKDREKERAKLLATLAKVSTPLVLVLELEMSVLRMIKSNSLHNVKG